MNHTKSWQTYCYTRSYTIQCKALLHRPKKLCRISLGLEEQTTARSPPTNSIEKG